MAENNNSHGCQNCPYESVIQELQKDSERNSNQHREFYNRFQSVETAQAVSDEKYNNLLSIMNEVKNSVNELKDKPTKRWDSVLTYGITCIVGLLLGYLFNVILR